MNIHIWHPNKKQIFYEVFIVNIKQYWAVSRQSRHPY
jgi:hypothetical protein